jgi:acyl-CoA synthetase (AMP-forming)/AMP-acid ligase II
VGEIAVAGRNVSPAYHARPQANAESKVTADCGLLHRTGDLGHLDEQGRLWFHGRKAHRVTGDGFTLNTEDIETLTDTAPGVRRTALVGIGAEGRQRAVLCAELDGTGGHFGEQVAEHAGTWGGRRSGEQTGEPAHGPVRFGKGIRPLAAGRRSRKASSRRIRKRHRRAAAAALRAILLRHPEGHRVERVLIHPGLPTDIRHNSKIDRERLAIWAAKRTGRST